MMQLYSTYGLYAAESDGTIDNDYRYGGKEFDTRNGINIYVFGARTYAPDIARFGSPTTIGCRPTPTAAATRSTA